MSEQPTDLKLEVNPEQASTNFYWTFGTEEVFNLQTTIRGILSPEQIEAHLNSAVSAMKAVVTRHGHAKPVGAQAYPQPVKNGNGAHTPAPEAAPVTTAVTPPPAAAPAAQQPAGDEVLETIACETMAATVDGGKVSWKIKGGRFTKYGVTIYSEALQSAGYDVEALDPRQVYTMTGKNAVVLVKDGKAKKITRLI